jgi:hypothetical protein
MTSSQEERILAGLDAMFEPNQLIEIRALKEYGANKKRTDALYTRSRETACDAIDMFSNYPVNPKYPDDYFDGVYYVMNPFSDDVESRYPVDKRLDYIATTVDDKIITRRKRMLIDFDPKRLKGVSSTTEEVRLAQAKAVECLPWVADLGFKNPIQAMSGNGWHLLFRVDEPNDAPTKELFKSLLASLAAKFGSPEVEIDLKVFNAARITKAYGSIARKGVNTARRPHRMSRIVENPYAG